MINFHHRTCVVAIFFLLMFETTSHAQHPGDLDTSFDGDGIVLADLNGAGNEATALAIRPDGKIITGGTGSGYTLFRHNPDGSLDTSFGVGGVVTSILTPFGGSVGDLALQPDGKIIVVGASNDSLNHTIHQFVIARYNEDGSLDTSFGPGGFATTNFGTGLHIVNAVVIQSDGKIVAAGGGREGSGLTFFAVARYNADGTPDTSFGTGGKVATSFANTLDGDLAYSVNLTPDGKIVTAGRSAQNGTGFDFAVARFTANGLLDNTFGVGGKVTTNINTSDRCLDSLVQPDGKIILSGDSNFLRAFTLVRYNTDGSRDSSFGVGGIAAMPVGTSENFINAITLQPDGKVLAAGVSGVFPDRDVTLVRYTANGMVDTSFGINGKVVTAVGIGTLDSPADIVLQTNGRIVIAGGSASDFLIMRYLNDSFATPSSTLFDYDGDGRSDISVYRPSTGAWYLQRSQAGTYGVSFGASTDRIAPADYDGDGKTDIAVYRPSTGIWYITNSSSGSVRYELFGLAEDLPTPADYDGDGKADISVFRPSSGTWYRINSSDGSFTAAQFGADGDRPTVGDFDGDRKADIAIFRPSTGAWYQTYSSNGFLFGEQFGIATDKITPADFDGDGKTDIAIYRPSEGLWYVKNSATTTYVPYVFGLADDIPVAADFDGDGKADIGVFRPSDGTWYIVNSSNGEFTIYQFGAAGDQPTESAFDN